MSNIYHIHDKDEGCYTVCSGPPHDPDDRACRYITCTFTMWGAKRRIKRELKKLRQKDRPKFWELPIVGSYTYEPREEAEAEEGRAQGGDRGAGTQGSPGLRDR